ncbi:MAG: hypothetical protein ABFD50_09335 [Smithella sp.]
MAGLCSILSKENAAMLPLSLLLFDLFLIQGVSKDSLKKYFKILFLPIVIILFFGLIYMGSFSNAFGGWSIRDFTMGERLLTEPRIIIFYLTLLFYPVNSRLTLLYDIDISHTLFHPWTTIPSILLIFFAIGFSFYFARKKPVISFCILFYFLNHAIEGSIFNLELIYEHRNYIPAMLLFVPVAIFFISSLNFFSARKILQFSMAMVIIIIIIGFGYNTYERNTIFSNDFFLWRDNNEKYPNLSRTHSNLGNAYLNNNERAHALPEYEKAMSLNNFGGIYARATQEHNLGAYKFFEGKYDEALTYFESSNKILPSYISNTIYIAKIHFLKNESHIALDIIKGALKSSPFNSDLNKIFCIMLLREEKFDEAEYFAKSILKNNLSNPFPLAVLAQTSKLKGNLKSAISLWKLYEQSYPSNASVNLALIELYFAVNDQEMLKKETARLFCLKGQKTLQNYIKANLSAESFPIYIPDYASISKIIKR